MTGHLRNALLPTFFVVLTLAYLTQAHPAQVHHQVEGHVVFNNNRVGNMRVRLVNQAEMRPITETFSRSDGQFRFTGVTEGDYLVETFETDKFDASTASVSIRPFPRGSKTIAFVVVELALKTSTGKKAPPGVVEADVDVAVPKAAQKHYRAAMKAVESGDVPRGISELQESIKIHSGYYLARLELGRQLGAQKRYQEAEEALRPLGQIAPRRVEPHLEYGKVLLALKRGPEAVNELLAAMRLEEGNWETHLYLGYALLETDAGSAEQYLKRATELNELKAARAHLALARLAEAKGSREKAIQHLDLYLSLVPNASDAEAVRKLAASLRK